VADLNRRGAEAAERTQPAGESVAELVQRASRQTAELVRQEFQLARAELKDKGRRVGRGAGIAGAGGLIAFYGGASLVAAAVFALATTVEPWLAALIVGVALVAIGGLLAVLGRREAVEALPPTPEQATASAHDDLEHIKESARR
jgi:Putative Actinobacterial Holin-X, holin superfamily III